MLFFMYFIFNKWHFVSLVIFLNQKTFVMQSKVNDLNFTSMLKSGKQLKVHSRGGWAAVVMTLILGILTSGINAQGWEYHFGDIYEDFGQAVVAVNDHGYLAIGYSESYSDDGDLDIYVVRTDVDGTLLWERVFDEGFAQHGVQVIQTENNGFLIAGDVQETVDGLSKASLLMLSNKGDKVWHKAYGDPALENTAADLTEVIGDSGYAFIGTARDAGSGNQDIILVRIDADGNEIWSKTYGDARKESGVGVFSVEDGFILAANVREFENSPDTDIYLFRTDAVGDTIWTKSIGDAGSAEHVHEIIPTSDGKFVVVGAAQNQAKHFIAKFDTDGNESWRRTFGEGGSNELNDVIEIEDGFLVAVGYSEVGPFDFNVFLTKMDADGNIIWQKKVGSDESLDVAEGLAYTQENGFIITGWNTRGLGAGFSDLSLISTDADGNVFTNEISGKVFYSPDGCNNYEDGDLLLKEWIIKATKGDEVFFGTTDANGYYNIHVDTGFYEVEVLPINKYWESCNPNGSTVEFSTFYDTTHIDIAIAKAIDCPYLEVDVSTEVLVACQEATYTLDYSNLGPTAVTDVAVEIELDEVLSFESASIPPAYQNGNVIGFDLGTMEALDSGRFTIETLVSCDNVLNNQAAFVSAHITPDTICTESNPNWDGSSIVVRGECDNNESLRFFVKNEGTGSMVQSRNAFIVEDQILFLREPFILNPGEEIEVTETPIEANGSTFRLIAEQSEGHPGESYPTVVVEGCVLEGESFSTGEVTQFPENDQDSYISIDVQEVVQPGIPLALRGYPAGYGDDNIITPDTDLEYTIIFEIPEEDTTNLRLVIRDTLSSALDPTTIVPGAGSHPYDIEVYNHNILKITFEEIQLQSDSSAELGFVKYKISQKPNNPIGTLIENSAAIYFDYHEPLRSNTTSHKVGCADFFDADEGCITTDIIPIDPEVLTIKVQPNPFREYAQIVLGANPYKELRFELYDAHGRLLRQERINGTTFDIHRENLENGFYVFKLIGDTKFVASGKILIQ